MNDERDLVDGDISHVEVLLRELTDEDRHRDGPPPDLWAAIEAEVDAGETTPSVAFAEVISIDRHRTLRRWMPLGAVAAAALIVVGLVVTSGPGDSTPPALASAQLSYDAERFDPIGDGASAVAALRDADGTFRLDISDAALPTPSEGNADLELWLIQPDAAGDPADLVSLGLIDPDDPGSFQIPRSNDPDVYFVVDISIEPRDGNPDHSGRSILRGPLVET